MKFHAVAIALVAVVIQAPVAFGQIRNIVEQKCLKCHGGESTLAGVNFASAVEKPERVLEQVRSGNMPKVGTKLTAEEIALVEEWVKAGAPKLGIEARPKRVFWSLRSPQKGSRKSIDEYIDTQLAAKGLKPNEKADPRTLIRRLHFDLTGLPPKPEDYKLSYEQTVDQLLASPHYAERWARHWLDVVRFGETDGGEHNYERMHAWPYRDYVIDAFAKDKPYTEFIREQIAGDILYPEDPKKMAATGFLVAGPWDQVSAELNKDKILAMTARVDELDDMATTTFHTFQALTVNCARCHDHKFDPIPSKDFYRLTAVYSGVTFGTRKVASEAELKAYDERVKPVKEKLAAVNRQIADIEDPVRARLLKQRYEALDRERAKEPRRIPINPMWNRNGFPESKAAHFRMVITGHNHDRAKLEQLRLEPAGLQVADWTATAKASVDAPAIIEIPNPQHKAVSQVFWWSDQKTGRNTGMPKVFRFEASEDGTTWKTLASSLDHIRDLEMDLPKVSPEELPERGKLLAERERIEAELNAIPAPRQLYAAKPKAMDHAYLLDRGSVAKPKEEVTPGALGAVAQLNPDLGLAPGATDADRRVALANWIASDKNPLTARVIVNRVWYNHFGNGIVNTPSDFGLNGDRPSHTELLDWLAISFMENGWSIKWLHKQILLSQAYQRSGAMNEANFAADADNRQLWRMPLKRMDAEMLRDSILAASGQLRLDAIGGPSFALQKKKDRGAFVYEALNNDGPEVWRRALYRFVVRGGERIMLDSFDCPDPSVATPQRSVSNTPVQALTLLNNDFVLRQAELLAKRLEQVDGREAQVRKVYQLLFGRDPNQRELALGTGFIEQQSLALYTRALFNTNEFLYVP